MWKMAQDVNKVYIDDWSLLEKVCLVSVVKEKQGDWKLISEFLKSRLGSQRPVDWYTPQTCAAQYNGLVKEYTDPKNKLESNISQVIRRLREICKAKVPSVEERNKRLKMLEKRLEDLKNKDIIPEMLDQYVNQVKCEEDYRKDQSNNYNEFIKQRNILKAKFEQSTTVHKPVGTSASTAPLLSSLLKSPVPFTQRLANDDLNLGAVISEKLLGTPATIKNTEEEQKFDEKFCKVVPKSESLAVDQDTPKSKKRKNSTSPLRENKILPVSMRPVVKKFNPLSSHGINLQDLNAKEEKKFEDKFCKGVVGIGITAQTGDTVVKSEKSNIDNAILQPSKVENLVDNIPVSDIKSIADESNESADSGNITTETVNDEDECINMTTDDLENIKDVDHLVDEKLVEEIELSSDECDDVTVELQYSSNDIIVETLSEDFSDISQENHSSSLQKDEEFDVQESQDKLDVAETCIHSSVMVDAAEDSKIQGSESIISKEEKLDIANESQIKIYDNNTDSDKTSMAFVSDATITSSDTLSYVDANNMQKFKDSHPVCVSAELNKLDNAMSADNLSDKAITEMDDSDAKTSESTKSNTSYEPVSLVHNRSVPYKMPENETININGIQNDTVITDNLSAEDGDNPPVIHSNEKYKQVLTDINDSEKLGNVDTEHNEEDIYNMRESISRSSEINESEIVSQSSEINANDSTSQSNETNANESVSQPNEITVESSVNKDIKSDISLEPIKTTEEIGNKNETSDKDRINQNSQFRKPVQRKKKGRWSSVKAEPRSRSNSPAVFVKPKPPQSKDLKTILFSYKAIAGCKYAHVFQTPISKQQVQGYDDVVYHPMDLSTIKKKIDGGQINTMDVFQHHILLMLLNAKMFNQADTQVYDMAVESQEVALSQLNLAIEITGNGVLCIPDMSKSTTRKSADKNLKVAEVVESSRQSRLRTRTSVGKGSMEPRSLSTRKLISGDYVSNSSPVTASPESSLIRRASRSRAVKRPSTSTDERSRKKFANT